MNNPFGSDSAPAAASWDADLEKGSNPSTAVALAKADEVPVATPMAKPATPKSGGTSPPAAGKDDIPDWAR
jgi:hypothetical protein